MSAQHRLFHTAIETTNLSCQVRVNDIPVATLASGSVTTELAVNPLVFSGDNTLDVIVRPAAGTTSLAADSGCEVKLVARPREKDAPETLAHIVFSALGGFDSSPGTTSDPRLRVSEFPDGSGFWARQPATVATPFGRWSWLDAPQLQADEATRQALYAELQQVWQLLSARDVVGLTQYCAAQAQDLRVAYDLPTALDGQRALGFQAMMMDPQVRVAPLPAIEEVRPELLADGRLAQLLDADGKSPVRLSVDNMPQMQGRFVCLFCYGQHGWTLIR